MSRHSEAWERGVLRWRVLIPALLVMALLFWWIMRGVTRDRLTAGDYQAQAEHELLLAQEEYDALCAELKQVGSSSYIENVARKDFSFLKKGELRFEITNPEDLSGYTYEEIAILQQERKPQ